MVHDNVGAVAAAWDEIEAAAAATQPKQAAEEGAPREWFAHYLACVSPEMAKQAATKLAKRGIRGEIRDNLVLTNDATYTEMLKILRTPSVTRF